MEEVQDPVTEISLADAKMMNSQYELGDIVNVEIKSKQFGRIATQNAKNVILQKIREEERKVIFNEYYAKEKDVVTGIVQRNMGRNYSINLGKADAILTENEQVKDRSIQAYREDQGLYPGSKRYTERSQDPGIQNSSGTGKNVFLRLRSQR